MITVETEIERPDPITVSWAILSAIDELGRPARTWIVCVPYNATMVGFYRTYRRHDVESMGVDGTGVPLQFNPHYSSWPTGDDFTKCYTASTLKRLLQRWLDSDGSHVLKRDTFMGESNLEFRAACGDGVRIARSEIEQFAAWL